MKKVGLFHGGWESSILQNKKSFLRLALLLQRKKVLETPGRAGCEEEQLHPSGVSLPRHPLQSVEQDAALRRNSELEQFWIAPWSNCSSTACRGASGSWFPLTTDKFCASHPLKQLKTNQRWRWHPFTRQRGVSRRALFPFAEGGEALSVCGTRAEGPQCLVYPGRGRASPQLIPSQQHEYIFFHSFAACSIGCISKTTLGHHY